MQDIWDMFCSIRPAFSTYKKTDAFLWFFFAGLYKNKDNVNPKKETKKKKKRNENKWNEKNINVVWKIGK